MANVACRDYSMSVSPVGGWKSPISRAEETVRKHFPHSFCLLFFPPRLPSSPNFRNWACTQPTVGCPLFRTDGRLLRLLVSTLSASDGWMDTDCDDDFPSIANRSLKPTKFPFLGRPKSVAIERRRRSFALRLTRLDHRLREG